MPDTEIADLGKNEGLEVVGTTIAVRNTGDGLSQAMKVKPQIMHHGEMIYVVIECKVIDVQHPFADDTETKVHRKHILKAGNAVTVPGDLVRSALNEMVGRIQKARDEATNATALDLDYDPLEVGEAGAGAGESETTAAKAEPVKKAAKKAAPRKAPGGRKATGPRSGK